MTFIQNLWGPNGLILFGALLSAVGVFWAMSAQSEVGQELKRKGDRIIEQNVELDEKSNEIQAKSDQLILQGQEVASLNKEIISFTTGGDSYPEVIFSSLNANNNSGMLIISNASDEYPMYDVQVRIVDLASEQTPTLDNLLADDKLLNIGIIPASTVYTGGKFTLGNVTENNFNIFSQTRNSSFTQQIRLKKLDNKWVLATRISKTMTGEVLKEEIDSGFPLNESGLVDWQ